MTDYPEELKQSLILKMLPPQSISVSQLAKETGIPKATLYTWRIKHCQVKHNAASKESKPAAISSEDKFTTLVETATMNEVELSAYCRRKGLYPEQIDQWKKVCMLANAAKHPQADAGKLRQKDKHIKQLEAELRRKEKALAEAAALLLLQKKVQAIWEEPGGE